MNITISELEAWTAIMALRLAAERDDYDQQGHPEHVRKSFQDQAKQRRALADKLEALTQRNG